MENFASYFDTTPHELINIIFLKLSFDNACNIQKLHVFKFLEDPKWWTEKLKYDYERKCVYLNFKSIPKLYYNALNVETAIQLRQTFDGYYNFVVETCRKLNWCTSDFRLCKHCRQIFPIKKEINFDILPKDSIDVAKNSITVTIIVQHSLIILHHGKEGEIAVPLNKYQMFNLVLNLYSSGLAPCSAA